MGDCTLLGQVTLAFSDPERDSLADRLEREFGKEEIRFLSPNTLAKALKLAGGLPTRILVELQALRFGTENRLGAVLLRNAPIDRDVPVQPQPTHRWEAKRTCVSEALHLVVQMACGGIPISYLHENEGNTVATLFPKEGDEEKQESSGQVKLELHGENLYHPFFPDLLSLSCLQEDGCTRVETTIACNRLVASRLDPQDIAVGRQPMFSVIAPASFKGLAGAGSPPMPMFVGSDEDLQLRFDAYGMSCERQDGRALLAKMTRLLEHAAVSIYLERSDLLVIDNRVTAHGRSGYRADLSHPRITQRAFGKYDFASTLPARRSGCSIMYRLS